MQLEIKNIHKNYGKVQALKGVSMELNAGVYGLLGPNGAGKSTLIQIITGNLSASDGEICYDGKNIKKSEKNYKRLLGYVPQSQGIYDSFTAKQFLEYMAILKDVDKKNIPKQINSILEVVSLTEVKDRKLGGFSGGMRQRILIGQALLGNPEIVILDEPTAGLDPKERIRIRNFISKIAENKIVLIATHVVSDVESIAKEIILLGNGVIAGKGTPEELCGALNGQVWECNISPSQYEEMEKQFVITNLQEVPGGTIRVRFIGQETKVNQIIENSIQVQSVYPNLQEVYLHIFSESR